MSRPKNSIALASTLLIGAGALVAVYFLHVRSSESKEIALTIDEPWEEMRKRSTADMSPAEPNAAWFGLPKTNARMRFIDAQYGFITQPAKFLSVTYSRQATVDGVRMSPQLEPLPLEDAIDIVLDLQNQWSRSGWKPAFTEIDPPIVDTPEWREGLKNCRSSRAYWRAAEKYQTQLNLDCFNNKKYPDTRYLISLELSRPY